MTLDYDTNADVENAKKPLSHASLIKAYVEGVYPYGEEKEQQTEFVSISKSNRAKKGDNNLQLDLFKE